MSCKAAASQANMRCQLCVETDVLGSLPTHGSVLIFKTGEGACIPPAPLNAACAL